MTYRINLDEMDAHAQKLVEVGQRVNMAAAAGDAASNPEAFGLLGIPLMAICAAAQHMAVNTLREASDAALDHVERVRSWREDVQNNEENQTALFDGMHRG